MRHTTMAGNWILGGALAAGLLAASPAGSAAGPAVIWVSQPVEPGEAVMVFGGPWRPTDCTVALEGPDHRTIEPLRVTEDCVTFVYPAAWPRTAFTARVGADGAKATVRINEPDVWWLQGDRGPGASPGGWLRAFGRGICYGDGAGLMLRAVSAQGAQYTLPASGNLYALRADLPAHLPAGDYDVLLNNGLAAEPVAAGRIAITPRRATWPDRVFNVLEYGAIPNDRVDDSRAIRAALVDLAADGGGILHFPRGRFGMTGTIELPPHTLLRGELADPSSPPASTLPLFRPSMLLSQIYWIDEDDPHGALVAGTHDFGVSDIVLVAGNIDEGIVTRPPEPESSWRNENILLQRVRTRFLHTDAATRDERFRRGQRRGAALRIGGDGIRIHDCEFVTTKGAYLLHGNYLDVRNNTFRASGHNQTLSFQGNYIVWEGNDQETAGTTLANDSRCLYFRGNRLGGIYGDGDRETFTFDGGGGTYSDTIESAGPASVTLKKVAWRHGADHWIGKALYIIGGTGAGQIRTITRIDKHQVEVDRAWDILPDETSHAVIAQARRELLMLDNTVHDGNPFQCYGSAVNAVLAGNRAARNTGIQVFAMSKGGMPEPSWFVQLIGNEILEGNSIRGPWSFVVPAEDGYLAFFDRGIAKPLTYPQARVGVMRRNILHNNAYLYGGRRVSNILVENNVVRQADRGAVIQSQGAILRGNRFEKVLRPYEVADDAVLDPRERADAEAMAAAYRQASQRGGPAPDRRELVVDQFLVAGPFKNRSGRDLDPEVHAAEMHLDVRRTYATLEGPRAWRAVTADQRGRTDLGAIFSKTEQATASVVAVLHAKRPVRVNVDFGGNRNTLAVVNGQRIGSSARRPGPAYVELQEGDNLFHLITSHRSGNWPVTLKVTILHDIEPGDLRVMPAAELFDCPILTSAAPGFAAHDISARDRGIHWRPVVRDNFNRTRFGSHWKASFDRPGYISTGVTMRDGAIQGYGGTAVITFAREKTPPPVRVECDVWLETPRSQFGVFLRHADVHEGDARYHVAPLAIGHRLLMRNGEVLLNNRQGGVYPSLATPGEWHHVVIQFVRPRVQFFYDGECRFDFEDPEWIDGLDEVALWVAPTVRVDNLAIYTSE